MTLNRLILLFLILIIGLAIIAYRKREGYVNTKTIFSSYLQLIDPVVKQINYFQGKDTKLVNKNTNRTCDISESDPDCVYVTDYDKMPTNTATMRTYKGTLDENQKKAIQVLLDRLIKPETIEGMLKPSYPKETSTEIDARIKKEVEKVLADLITLVTPEVYAKETSNINAMLSSGSVSDTDKTKLLSTIAFFNRIGDISAAKSAELYSGVWDTTKNKDTGLLAITATDIEAMIVNLKIPNYAEKLEIRKQIEYFRQKIDPLSKVPELSEPEVARIYDKLYKDHTPAGLRKVFVDLALAIDDYDNKVKAIPSVITKTTDSAYNANITDVTYHESAEDIRAKDTTITVPVKDASGNIVASLPWDKAVTTTPRYNDSSYFRYSPSPYVPNYEDSVYLSRTTSYNDSAQLVDHGLVLPAAKGGFCEANKNNKLELETQCGKIGKDACASMSCCVLLGGSKCVTGNEAGPSMKSNYSDISVLNRDYYYYQGKCYGNCPS